MNPIQLEPGRRVVMDPDDPYFDTRHGETNANATRLFIHPCDSLHWDPIIGPKGWNGYRRSEDEWGGYVVFRFYEDGVYRLTECCPARDVYQGHWHYA